MVFYITTLTVAIYIIPSFFVRNFHALGFTVRRNSSNTVRMRTCPLPSKWLMFIVTCVEQAVYRDTPDWVNVAQNLLTLAVRQCLTLPHYCKNFGHLGSQSSIRSLRDTSKMSCHVERKTANEKHKHKLPSNRPRRMFNIPWSSEICQGIEIRHKWFVLFI